MLSYYQNFQKSAQAGGTAYAEGLKPSGIKPVQVRLLCLGRIKPELKYGLVEANLLRKLQGVPLHREVYQIGLKLRPGRTQCQNTLIIQ